MAPKKGNSFFIRYVLFICIFILVAFISYIFLHSDAGENLNSLKYLRTDKTDIPQNLFENAIDYKNIIHKNQDVEKKIENNNQIRNNIQIKKKVAYAITVTKDSLFIDGALVLGYAAKKIHDEKYGFHSKYDAELVAFVTSSVQTSRQILTAYGWKVLERKLPVTLEEIQNIAYMNKMKDSGCCGADEFLKLWAYTLTEYHRVIHLDMDSIIFKNMDVLYEIDKELLYTGDYNMMSGSPAVPAQGGFLVIRPSIERFEEFRGIIRKGDHGPKGWGGTGIGNFWGGSTIQGIIPYFYYAIHPGDAQELNRCVYNFMADNPYRANTNKCINKQPTCEDCRLQNPENIISAHFTICQKPWTCPAFDNPRNNIPCAAIHKKWFTLRDEFEQSLQINNNYRVTSSSSSRLKQDAVDIFQGMCRAYGQYIPIPLPTTS